MDCLVARISKLVQARYDCVWASVHTNGEALALQAYDREGYTRKANSEHTQDSPAINRLDVPARTGVCAGACGSIKTNFILACMYITGMHAAL